MATAPKPWLVPRKRDDEELWLLSFGDMITLLLGFFVLLYTASAINEARYQAIVSSLRTAILGEARAPRPAVPPPRPAPPARPAPAVAPSAGALRDYDRLLIAVRRFIADRGLGSQMVALPTPRGVEVTAAGSLLFPSGSAELEPAAEGLLATVAELLRELPLTLIVEGHTDDQPIQSERYPSNWELSTARASRVIRALAERGVAPVRMSAAGYADTRPVAHPDEGADPAPARARNRRVVLVFAREEKGAAGGARR